MNRISRLFAATALAVMPISAFAQQNAAPATAAPATAQTMSKGSDTVAPPAKTDVKTPTHSTKSEVHGMNGVKSHEAKSSTTSSTPAKTNPPAKS